LILKDRSFHNPTVITYVHGQLAGTTGTPTFGGAYAVITDDQRAPPYGVVGDIEITDAGAFVQVARIPITNPPDYVTKLVPSGTRARIAVTVAGECYGSYDDGLNVVATLATLAPAADGEIGLRTTNTSATFDSVTVIESDP
jgi:hypothetical protein